MISSNATDMFRLVLKMSGGDLIFETDTQAKLFVSGETWSICLGYGDDGEYVEFRCGTLRGFSNGKNFSLTLNHREVDHLWQEIKMLRSLVRRAGRLTMPCLRETAHMTYDLYP